MYGSAAPHKGSVENLILLGRRRRKRREGSREGAHFLKWGHRSRAPAWEGHGQGPQGPLPAYTTSRVVGAAEG